MVPEKRHTPLSPRSKALADATAGMAASLISLWMFYPIDVYKTGVQAGNEGKSLRLQQFYAGVRPKSLHTASSSFCYFYLYSWIYSIWTKRQGHNTTATATRLMLSAIAAMLNTCITLPLDVISSRKQNESYARSNKDATSEECRSTSSESTSCSESDDKYFDASNGTDCITQKKTGANLPPPPPTRRNILPKSTEMGGVNKLKESHGLWKGLRPSLLLCSNPAINFTVFDSLKARILARRGQEDRLSLLESFSIGLVAKFVATIITYPLIRAKVLLMVTERESLWQTLLEQYTRHGVSGLYKGCNLQLIHTLLKSAFLMMTRERIHDMARNLVLGVQNGT